MYRRGLCCVVGWWWRRVGPHVGKQRFVLACWFVPDWTLLDDWVACFELWRLHALLQLLYEASACTWRVQPWATTTVLATFRGSAIPTSSFYIYIKKRKGRFCLMFSWHCMPHYLYASLCVACDCARVVFFCFGTEHFRFGVGHVVVCFCL